MSANGMVVVGDSPSTSYPAQAFRWTAATGMVGLVNLSGQAVSEGLGVNADGSVVVGYDGYGGCGNNVAFRWTQATGQVSLGFPPGGGNFSVAYATNANGKVVVGNAGVCGSGNQASRWTAATGWVALANLPGAIDSVAFGVNANGSVVVGNDGFADGTHQAIMWTAASGTAGLGFLPGGTNSGAGDVSADGKVVVGGSNGTGGANQAFRWTAATGMVGLGFLSGATDSGARRVSSGVVVGDSGGKAFLWTHRDGMKSVQDLLSAAGANVTGWQLTSARGVSVKKKVITISGQGIDPLGRNQGWIATLPRAAHDGDTS